MRDVILDGGLDLITPPALAPAGSLRDCQNYEAGIYPGYQSSGGFERFDGHISPSTTDIWDLSIATEAIRPSVLLNSLSVASEDTTPQGFTFGDNGRYMYMVGWTGQSIYEYVLSTPFGLETAFHDPATQKLLVDTVDPSPAAISFSPDGLRMFMLGRLSNKVFQFDLVNPWRIGSGATVSAAEVSISTGDVEGMTFSADGKRLYVTSAISAIQQFTLPTAWDLAGAVGAGGVAVVVHSPNPTGIQFASSGAAFYLGNNTVQTIGVYGLTELGDVTSASWLFDVDGLSFAPGLTDLYMSDGHLFVLQSDGIIREYALGFAANEVLTWARVDDAGTLGVVISQTNEAQDTVVRMAFRDTSDHLPDGATVTGERGSTFAVGLGNLRYANDALNTVARGIWYRADGLEYYIARDNLRIDRLVPDMQWSLFPATVVESGGTDMLAVADVAVSKDGTKMLALGNRLDGITNVAGVFAYTLGTPWQLSTAVNVAVLPLIAGQMTVNREGTRLYTAGNRQSGGSLAGGVVREYSLSTAWDLDTAVLTASLEIPDPLPANRAFDEKPISGITWDNSGTVLHVNMPQLREIHTWVCQTPWSLASAVAGSKWSWYGLRGAPFATNAILFGLHLQGSHLYIVGDAGPRRYDLYPEPVLNALLQVANGVVDYENQLAAAADVLRQAITQVPGSGPVLGVKWYRDQLSAVRDYYRVNFRLGLMRPEVGQHVLIGDGDYADPVTSGPSVWTDEGIVRKVDLLNGSFTDFDAAGAITIEPLASRFDVDNRLRSRTANNVLSTLAELYFTSGSVEPTVNQKLVGQTSLKTFTVWRTELRSGSWEFGDAAGVIYCLLAPSLPTAGELMDLVDPATANVLTADNHRPLIYSTAGAANYAVVYHSLSAEPGDMAGLYHSTQDGWNKLPLGHEIRFVGGAAEPVVNQFGADTSTAIVVASSWGVASLGVDAISAWTASAGTRIDALKYPDGAYVRPASTTFQGTTVEAADDVGLYGFDLDIPVGARVVGIEVMIRARNGSAPNPGAALTRVQPFLFNAALPGGGVLPGVQPKRQALGELGPVFEIHTFGGESDLWGAGIDRAMVINPNFGVRLQVEWETGFGGAATLNMQIEFVQLRVHYVEQGQLCFFWDSVGLYDYATARLVNFHLETGSWAGADAAGVMHVYELSKPQVPTKNIQIRSDSGGAGTLIATMDGNEHLVSLPGSQLLIEHNSKYEIISANAYARDDLEAIYGVSGAGPAFTYDGFYVRLIRTGIAAGLDKPRHVDLFQFRLWLGYDFGEAAISVAGNPLSFDGTLNAVATGFGRPITGFARLPGETLGVFTDSSVYAVTVQGSDFRQQVFAPSAGAREYTIHNVGSDALYADARGVSTPQATERYGDFEIGRLSWKVHPWLLPRVQRRESAQARGRTDVVAATISRAKNQYRLYFADGFRLTLTLRGDQLPIITRQFLYTDGDPTHYVRVLGTESEVWGNGRERMFFTMDVNPDYDHSDALGYCYEEDAGNSYDGSAYARFIELTPLAGKDIHSNTLWSVLHLYGMAHGYAALDMTTALDFARPGNPVNVAEDALYKLALGTTNEPMAAELVPYWDKERIKRRGRHLALRIQQTSDRAHPHLLQHLALAESLAREER